MARLLFWRHSKAFESMQAESTSLKETQTEQSLSSQKQSICEETGYKIACPELTPLASCNLWFYQWCIVYIKMLLKWLLHTCNWLDVIDGYDTCRLTARRKCTVGSFLWHAWQNVAATALSSRTRMWWGACGWNQSTADRSRHSGEEDDSFYESDPFWGIVVLIIFSNFSCKYTSHCRNKSKSLLDHWHM
jgi:hypothetical protein